MSRNKRLCLFYSLFISIIFYVLLISISNAEPPAPFIINGPSQMSINQTATLTVSGGCGEPYHWSASTGSLSSTIGDSVRYTSPSSNPNCDLNPIISVTDKAGQIVYKQIAINAYTVHDAYAYVNYYEIGSIYNGWDCSNDWGYPTVVFTFQPHYCDGTPHNPFANKMWGYSCDGARDSIYNTFKNSYLRDGYYQGCHNFTSPAMKAAGCCTTLSLDSSSVPPPVTVPQCTTCDLQIDKFNAINDVVDRNGFVNFEGHIISSKPFTWEVKINGTAIKSGTSADVSAIWSLKDQNFKQGESKQFTAILNVTSNSDNLCKDSKPANFKVTAREKDCKLEITAESSLNILSGNLSHSQNLFTVPNSGLMSDFTLYYNSMDSYSGVLGTGWTHNYNIFISTDPTDDAYILSDGRGGMISLYKNGDYYTSDISAYPMLQVNANNTFTLTYKNGSVYNFNTNGRLTAITDKNGNAVNLCYSSGGNLVNITNPSGKAIYLSYDGNNRISTINDPNNNSYAFTYSGTTLASVSSHNSLGTQTWHYTYDSKAFMLTKTDPQGNLVQYAYDAEHRVSQTIDPQGYARNIQYDPENNTTTVTEKDGGVWVYQYDPSLGALLSKADPSGGTTRYQYDSNRNLTSKIEADGSSTNYTYDGSGNMTSLTDALNNTTTYTYNDQNLVTGITDATGRQTSYTYDANGNMLSTTDPSGSITHYTYDSKGNIIAMTNPNGGVTQMAYDYNNNLISITDPRGQTTSQTYDNLGNMISQTDAAGNQTTFQYNSLNQLVAVTDSAGQTTRYTYDANDNRLSATDANGNTTTYEYNYKNQLIKTTDALGETTSFTYGSGGCSSCGGADKLTAVTDAKNHTTTYQYDNLGRLIKETDPLGNATSYTYDSKGNMVSKTKPDGRTINYVYDALNRLSERIYPNGTSDVFEYDQAGNLVGTTNQNIAYYYGYDASNRLTGVTIYNLAKIFNIEYQYDTMGNRKAMTFKEGTATPKVINYDYNINNQMTKITSDMGSFTFAYDALGRRIKRTLPNHSYTTYAYDPLSRLTAIKHINAFNQSIDSFNYTHDNVGNRISKKDGHKSINYSYDQLYRLTRATPKSHNALINLLNDITKLNTESYSYDPVGNRQTGPDRFDSYTYNDGNELLTSTEHPHQNTQREYDLNGNIIKKTEIIGKWKVITSYTYDDENRLIYVSIQKGEKNKEISFAYDPFGRRISKTIEKEEFTDEDDNNKDVNNNENDNNKDNHQDQDGDKHHHGHHKDIYPQITYYVYDEQNIIAESDQNGKQTASYVHGPNIDEPLAAEIKNNRIYYHADGLGSITSLTNHMGHKVQEYDYDSFGNIKSTPFWIKQPYTYTGREFDYETELYYYRARYYDAQVGRFITRDPIGFGGGDVNLYNYVGGNPVNMTDPFGLWIPSIHKDITRIAAIQLNCSKKADALAEENAIVDNLQDAQYAYMHAMSNGKIPAGRQNDINDYNKLINEGENTCDDIAAIGKALHAKQDYFAPAHTGFQPWSNKWWEYSKHMSDPFAGSGSREAYSATLSILSGIIARCPCFCEK